VNTPETIDTARLTLRRAIPEHAQAVFDAYATDAEVTRYLCWQPHKDVGETIEFLTAVSSDWDENKSFTWSIFHRAEEKLLGMIDLRIDRHRAECGYVLKKSGWGCGYMSEVLVEIRDIAFSLPGIERFQIFCDVENKASARVMEKAGFEKEGVLRKYIHHPNISEEARDCFCYSRIR